MSQYINLLGPAFRKQRLLLTLNRAVLLLTIVMLTLAGMLAYDSYRVDGLREELASAQGLLKAQNAYTSRLKGDGAQKGNITLDAEIQRLEAELKSARDSMGVLEGGALGAGGGWGLPDADRRGQCLAHGPVLEHDPCADGDRPRREPGEPGP